MFDNALRTVPETLYQSLTNLKGASLSDCPLAKFPTALFPEKVNLAHQSQFTSLGSISFMYVFFSFWISIIALRFDS
jgi:hypothetical protein